MQSPPAKPDIIASYSGGDLAIARRHFFKRSLADPAAAF
jgi:hypothetical protein